MKALSIKQPWAWAILNSGKDVENRSWSTPYRGPLLIHAGKRPDNGAVSANGIAFLRERGLTVEDLFAADEAPRGGIVGIVNLIDCVKGHASPWAVSDEWHWVLSCPEPVRFHACNGQLGLFEATHPGLLS